MQQFLAFKCDSMIGASDRGPFRYRLCSINMIILGRPAMNVRKALQRWFLHPPSSTICPIISRRLGGWLNCLGWLSRTAMAACASLGICLGKRCVNYQCGWFAVG